MRRRASSRRAIASQPPAGASSSGSAANASCQPAGGSGGREVKSAMVVFLDLQQRAQAARAACQLRLGEARRALHQRGDLLVGVALGVVQPQHAAGVRSEEHTSELQSLMRISYAVFCLKKKKR